MLVFSGARAWDSCKRNTCLSLAGNADNRKYTNLKRYVVDHVPLAELISLFSLLIEPETQDLHCFRVTVISPTDLTLGC